MQRIGILGGTFNPVHKEHINIALMACKELSLDKLFIMPTYISPHKKNPPISAEHRLNMLRLATENHPEIEVSDFEIQKGGKSYTYQTVEHFKALLNGEGEIFFICGADMLVDFKTWRYPERILSACTLAVFGRQDFYADYEKEQDYFIKTFNKKFIRLDYVGQSDSSTKIRLYAKLGLDISGLTDKKVEDYILKNNLYIPNKYEKFITENLTKKRLRHTANVTVTALSKAKELNLDAEKVEISALLHDCAKYLLPEMFKDFSLEENLPAPVVHSFLGAYVAEKVLGITDVEVLEAIKYHTSGKAEMTTLGKLIFVADMVEEGRTYEGVEKLRELYYFSDFEGCFKECLKEEMLHLNNKNAEIYYQTINAYNYYVKGNN